ncbi:hypothetical protein AYO21_09025 [Fonsecaea monophora]|uniref:Aflatoxin regulatory protein domain-containing protein n=1 Tax=Fonsecaea monophora TaxID=254056 RepID=A0A177F0B9_9EURO|nr:hypothetical protein AYO21_09025 [Fonsecaea monophora]OAG36752.1 hypothetical protein AYO21_09025 [Fonsecaea monophora]
MFDLELAHFDAVFPVSPTSQPGSGEGSTSFVPPASEQTSEDAANVAPGTHLVPSGSSPKAEERRIAEDPGTVTDLAKAFQDLEATFLRTMRNQTGNGTQDYAIGEVLNALDDFLGALRLSNVAVASHTSTPQSPHGAHLRSKQASIAAQGYVLCVRLLASSLEQMLQSLMASPSPAPILTASGTSAGPSETQHAGSLRTGPGVSASLYSDASSIPRSLRLGDLFVAPDPFGHALNSSVDLLRVGCSRLNKMEGLLGIPSNLREPSTSSLAHVEPVDLGERAARDNDSSRQSLPARFVTSIWEDEASINKKSSVVCLQRYRAAILGLTEHCL